MWPYSFVTREEFEKRKDFVGSTLCRLGCTAEPWHPQKMTMYGRGFQETWTSERPLYHFRERYILISEVLFSKPFIVLEIAHTREEAVRNIMEDEDPFPYDLSDEQIVLEVKRSIEWEEQPLENVT